MKCTRRQRLAADLIWRYNLRWRLSDARYYRLMDRFGGNNGFRPLRMRYPKHFGTQGRAQQAQAPRGGVPPSERIDP